MIGVSFEQMERHGGALGSGIAALKRSREKAGGAEGVVIYPVEAAAILAALGMPGMERLRESFRRRPSVNDGTPTP